MNKKILTVIGGTLLSMVLLLGPNVAHAVDCANREGGQTQTGIRNPICANSFLELVEIILRDIVSPILAIVAVFFLMYSGFLFVTAQGNETQLTKAKGVLKWTLIGLFVLIGARVFAEIIQATVTSLGE
ncbi:MAG: hypothetical protein WDZ88_00895 [Candidatus Paceibacterota bacterium]